MPKKVHDKNEAEYEPAPFYEKPSSCFVTAPGGGSGKQHYLLTRTGFLIY